jgi:hypothetical protein
MRVVQEKMEDEKQWSNQKQEVGAHYSYKRTRR